MRPTRRGLEIALGLLWLLDGALQAQPAMFGRSFFPDLLGMATMGMPEPVVSVETRIADLLAAQPVLVNAIFAALQLALGLGLLWRHSAGVARGVSVVWALGIWAVGEGFGGVGMTGAGLLTGAPGAALIYAILSLALWPASRPPHGTTLAVADRRGVLSGRWFRYCWLLIWLGLAVLEFEPVNHAAGVPAAQLADAGESEPAAIATVNRAVGALVGNQGLVFAVLIGLCAAFAGIGILAPRLRRAALLVGIVLAVVSGIFGQDLGGLFTGQATDPGTGPPLVLFALALWPRTQRPAKNSTPHKEVSGDTPFGLTMTDQKNV